MKIVVGGLIALIVFLALHLINKPAPPPPPKPDPWVKPLTDEEKKLLDELNKRLKK